jgi:hypothetical protein
MREATREGEREGGRGTCEPSPASKSQVLPAARKAIHETLLGWEEGWEEGGREGEVGVGGEKV